MGEHWRADRAYRAELAGVGGVVLLRLHTMAAPHGYIRSERDDGRTVEHDAMQCVHCQRTWRFIRGSGRERGWCARCGGVTCGSKACMDCLHFERRAELAEARR